MTSRAKRWAVALTIVMWGAALVCCSEDSPAGKGGCIYNDKTYQHGDSFPSIDGCNTCGCVSGGQGGVACTKIACAADGGAADGRPADGAVRDGNTPPQDSGLTDGSGMFACGKVLCTPGQVCVHPCCGGAAPPCIPTPDAGVCPAGFVPGCQLGCTTPPCTPDPPYCSAPNEVPSGCDHLSKPNHRDCTCA